MEDEGRSGEVGRGGERWGEVGRGGRGGGGWEVEEAKRKEVTVTIITDKKQKH